MAKRAFDKFKTSNVPGLSHEISVYVASRDVLARTLMRKRHPASVKEGVDLGLVLKEIVEWAHRLVPSASSSILLDDPVFKLDPHKDGRLYFAAASGKNSASLAGTYIPVTKGIAGETYRRGKPYICQDVNKDKIFLDKIDKKIKHKTQSIISSPIRLKGSVIGVIELINRLDKPSYDADDLALLEIFAGYIATLIENALAAGEFVELAKRDNLTGLYNDRYMFLRLEEEVERASRNKGDNALIFFDLDRFKEINDNHGHLAGSRVLKEIGMLLRSIFRGTNAVTARYGGDEYVVLMPGKGIKQGKSFADALKQAIERNVFLKRKDPHGEPALKIKGVITSSIGVASQKRNVKKTGSVRHMAEALLRAADDAMYQAKETGKNRVCVAGGRI